LLVLAFFKNTLEYFPLILGVSRLQTNPVHRITNLPRFLCVFNRNMQLSV